MTARRVTLWGIVVMAFLLSLYVAPELLGRVLVVLLGWLLLGVLAVVVWIAARETFRTRRPPRPPQIPLEDRDDWRPW